MKITKRLMYSLIRAKDWLKEADSAFVECRLDDTCGYWGSLAANHLVMAIISVLRAELANEGVDYSTLDSCDNLLLLCKGHGIDLPVEYMENSGIFDTYQFEANYSVDFVLDIMEFKKFYEVTKSLVDALWGNAFVEYVEMPEVSSTLSAVPSLREVYKSVRYLQE